MLIRTKGNLITMAEEGHFDVILQGCNCFTTQGSGLAKEIKSRYPAAYKADLDWNKSSNPASIDRLGNYSDCHVTSNTGNGNTFNIVNAYAQHGFNSGKQFEDVFEYESFHIILKKILHHYGKFRIGLPYLGMGLAGGNSLRIIPMIEQFALDCEKVGGTVTLVEFA